MLPMPEPTAMSNSGVLTIPAQYTFCVRVKLSKDEMIDRPYPNVFNTGRIYFGARIQAVLLCLNRKVPLAA